MMVFSSMGMARMVKFESATCAAFAILFAVTTSTAALAQQPKLSRVDYRWSFYTGTGGISNASIKAKDGSLFEISCAALGNRKMEVFLKSPIARARNQDIQVVVDDDDFHFNLTNGTAEIGGRHGINQLGGLVDALRKTKETHFTVEMPATGKSISFSTLGAAKNLKDILAGCL
jgi:hypothetical protein